MYIFFDWGGISYITGKHSQKIILAVSLSIILEGYLIKLLLSVSFLTGFISSVQLSIYVLVIILITLLLPSKGKDNLHSEWLAPASRFMYYSHEAFLQLFRLLLPIFPLCIQSTILFITTTIVTTIISLFLYSKKIKFVSKYLF